MDKLQRRIGTTGRVVNRATCGQRLKVQRSTLNEAYKARIHRKGVGFRHKPRMVIGPA